MAVNDDLDVVVPLAQVLEKTGAKQKALEVYRRALSLSPDDARAREGLSRLQGQDRVSLDRVGALRGQGESEEADPDARGIEERAHAAFQARDFKRSARLYAEAIEALKEVPSARLLKNYALALHKATRLRAALSAYDRALEANPKDAELHFSKAMAYVELGQWSGASRALQSTLALEPGHPQARFELGVVALKRGRHGEAARAFEESLRRKPDDKRALQNLVKARLDGGDQKGALEALGQMHAAHPADAQTLMSMAALLQNLDRDDEAEALLKDACTKGITQACP